MKRCFLHCIAVAAAMLLPLSLNAITAERAQPDNLGGGTGTTYYLDVNSGSDGNNGRSEGAAWKTFQKAIDSVSAGDTVLIKNGNYHSTVNNQYKDWQINVNGSPGQYITFRAYPGHRPRFHVDTWNGIEIYNSSYLELDGLEVVGLPDPSSIVGKPENDPARKNLASDPRYFGNGISTVGSPGNHHIRIRNCTVSSVGGNGISLGAGTIILVEGNTVYNCSHRSDAGNSGISAAGLYDNIANPANYGLAIIGNVSYNNVNYLDFKYYSPAQITDGNGIIIDWLNGARNGAGYDHRTLVANNVCYNNGGRGVHSYNSSHVDFVNNTVWKNLQSQDLIAHEGELSAVSSSDINFYNNIAVARNNVKAYNNSASGNARYNHVLSNRSDQDWLDSSNTKSGDPKLVNPSSYTIDPADFALRSDSPAIDSGMNFYEISSDFADTSRPQGSGMDKGAFEREGTVTIPTYTLSVSNGSGDGSYEAGTTVNIAANSAPTGKEFDQWTGDTSAVDDRYDSTTTVTMPSSNVSVTATYKDLPTYRTPENPSGTTNGVEYEYYHGAWDVLPNFNSLTPVKTGTDNNFDIDTRTQDSDFGYRFSGYINVPTDGDYTFYTSSDDGSKLYIGSTQVVDNDGLHATQERSGTIGLKAGKHAITVTFFERSGGEILDVKWSGPDISKTNIPSSALYFVGSTAPTTYTLSVSNGSGDGSYEAGTTVNIAANSAPSGKEFDQWTGDTSAVADRYDSTTTVTMPSSNVSVTATYKDLPVATYTLSVGNGSGDGSYAAGTTVNIAANPAPSGKEFDRWTGDTSALANRYDSTTTVTMPASNVSVTATYKDLPSSNDPIVLEFENLSWSSSSGSSAFAKDDTDASNNSRIQVTNDGGQWQWVEFSVNNLPTGVYDLHYRYVTWDNRAIVQAAWNGNNTGSAHDQNGPRDGAAEFRNSNTISITVEDSITQLLRFTAVGKSASSSGYSMTFDSLTLTRTGDLPTAPTTYTLSVSNGSGDGSYEAGTTVNIAANSAPSGKEFDQWTGDTSAVADRYDSTTTVTMPASNVSVTATYKDLPVATYTLSVSNGSGDGSYAAGTTVNIAANSAPSGKEFDQWTGDTSAVADRYDSTTTVTMPSSNVSVTATYKDLPSGGEYRTPENPSNTQSGVEYRYYEGDWSMLPNFDSMSPKTTGTQEDFMVWRNNEQSDLFGFSFTGYVEVPTTGEYTFYTSSDDGSKLYIGSTQIVDNDGLHGSQERSGKIKLQAGKHAIRVDYFERYGGQRLEVRYSGPGVSKDFIPASALSH